MRMLPVMIVGLLCLSVCDAYRFLAVFPFEYKSHFIILESLMKGLIGKGHQVDVISHFPQKTPCPNYTDLATLPMSVTLLNNMSYEFISQVIRSCSYSIVTLLGNDLCEAHLKNPVIRNLVRDSSKNPPYDAVIIEVFGAYCFSAIATVLNVPLIGVATTSLHPWHHQLIAQPENLAFVPNNCVSLELPMNLWQRIYNVLCATYMKLNFNYHVRAQDDLVREHLGPNLPSVRDMKLSLLLVNSHVALNIIEPMTPAALQIGGIHIRDDNSSLIPELKKWMDDSKDGFVYFSFGSTVMLETFPQKILQVFYSSLRKIAPIRVLMKISKPEDLPAGLPENIRTSAWLPQFKILKHPNVRAFITHGGYLGTLEAIACGVPMIGMPLFGDQFKNVNVYVARNVAVKLNIHEVTEQGMDAALNAVLYDPRYMQTVRNLSRRFLDQPMSPIDTANYWIEYVIKYGDVLRSPAMDLTWWQLSLVDVAACLLLCVIIIVIVTVFITRLVIRMISGDHYRLLNNSKKTN